MAHRRGSGRRRARRERLRAAELGYPTVRFDENGWPLKLRVTRYPAAIMQVINAYNGLHRYMQILVEGVPGYEAPSHQGLGTFLLPPPQG